MNPHALEFEGRAAMRQLQALGTGAPGLRLYHGSTLDNWKDFLRYGIEPRPGAAEYSGCA